jgi:undecaprenyl-diphosphatase
MNFFQASILGIIEGITEFLPISSTFHLIVTGKLMNLPQTDFIKLFDVFIQSGAILAVILLYFEDLLKQKKLLVNILLSFIPTAIIGLLLHKIIKNFFFEDMPLMLSATVIVSLLFILLEYLIKKGYLKLNKNISKIDFTTAILIGVFQALAVIPGVSRSGATIGALMLFGYKRPEAALYSFFLSIPTILAAGGLDLLSSGHLITQSNNLIILITGFITSFIAASVAIRWLIKYLQTHSLIPFAIYRIILSLLLIKYLV